jgi:hypothetical protein
MHGVPTAEAQRGAPRPDARRLRSDPRRVVVRRWGWTTYAAYVFDGTDRYGRFVGTETSRPIAFLTGVAALDQAIIHKAIQVVG